ncbi:unnamed protein product [Fraxinus pennsylvanica]|uniref:Uncharacterized protein n=1 Tax=Fraxinus pennsylvanica TaxID=56036 RepID=A0AAD2DIT0_9LAMI|nr:unnamed protein product [Fraxinus pennsylvanica]
MVCHDYGKTYFNGVRTILLRTKVRGDSAQIGKRNNSVCLRRSRAVAAPPPPYQGIMVGQEEKKSSSNSSLSPNASELTHSSDLSSVLLKTEGSSSNVAPETKSVTRPTSSQKASKRLSDSITNFTVQCANCLKWRFIPTKEKYEQIRETIVEQPFVCEMAHEWRPEVTCDVEPDLVKDDGSWRWAIDKPSIPKPPPGWQRILRLRAEGGTKFADVYYVPPSSGKWLRTTREVERYLNEHPEYIGVKLRCQLLPFPYLGLLQTRLEICTLVGKGALMLSHLQKVEDGIAIIPTAGSGRWLNTSQHFIA